MKQIIFGICVCAAILPLQAQTVFVNTVAAPGKFTSLNEAINAVTANTAEPDEIIIENEGPFFESRVIINESKTHSDLTIRAVDGVRPIVAIDANADGGVYIRKAGGPLILKDLIIIPQLGDPATRAQAGIKSDNVTDSDTSVTLQNILVTSNDGFNRPLASLDGLTPPVWTSSVVSFRDEGILHNSSGVLYKRNYYMYDCIVSGISGDQGSDGIRIFTDGIPGGGNEVIVGPGCVVSYMDITRDQEVTSSTNSGRGGIQPGANINTIVKIQGTQDKPVMVFNNNLNGISETFANGQSGPGFGLLEVEWCIVANNAGVGFNTTDFYADKDIKNVTFANNGDGVFNGASSDFADMDYRFSNVIFGGNGQQTDPSNIVDLTIDGEPLGMPTYVIADSALPLSGSVSLNNVDYGADGIATNVAVTMTNITNADPQFVSLDPASGGFAVVSNQTYATAGPGGQPLVGGGSMAKSSVEDWQLF
jgi:hypothetical protein